jgi:uncharacterized protein (TIGR02145 family)
MNRTSSIRLIKWVEPYFLAGKTFTLFYTEVDHNFKLGDKVFIEGGFYDSDKFITDNDESNGLDGYKVLFVDRTAVALNIEFSGEFPTNEEPIDNFIKTYVATDQYQFEYYIQNLSFRRDDIDIVVNKFELTNNFLYVGTTVSIDFSIGDITGFLNPITSITYSQSGPGFFVKSGYNLIDITGGVLSGSYSTYLNPDIPSKEKLRIIGDDFNINNLEFKNEYIYQFLDGTWVVDKSYLPTIITKSHFKSGKFKSGKVLSGLIGSHESNLEWNGDSIKWELGTTLNLVWNSGVMGSDYFREMSWFTILDRFGNPTIKFNSQNNGGSGYNYVFNTDFKGGDIINGNIFNLATTFGDDINLPVVDSYLNEYSITYSVHLKGGVYYNSDIRSAEIENSTIISSYVRNSLLNNVKSVNSELEESVFLNSNWLSDKVIKVLDYYESNLVWYGINKDNINYKLYRFYISPQSYLRIRNFQNFYIDGLEISGDDELLNFFEQKFTIGFHKYLNKSVLIQLSTAEENRNLIGDILLPYNNELEENLNPLPSIDIYIESGGDFDTKSGTSSPRDLGSHFIDISNAFILESDFISGVFKDSNWISGNNFNYNELRFFDDSALEIDSSGCLNILSEKTDRINPLKVDNIVFTNGLYLKSGLRLPTEWKIIDISDVNHQYDLIKLKSSENLDPYGGGNILNVPNALNKWNYFHPIKFINSNIKSGIFKGSYFENCRLSNGNINVSDKDFTNIVNKKLLLINDSIFIDGGNVIENATFYNSYLLSGSDKFKGGIFYNSLFDHTPIKYNILGDNIERTLLGNGFMGLFKMSYWKFGKFLGGDFYENRTTKSLGFGTFDDVNFDNIDPIKTFPKKIRWTWESGDFLGGNFQLSNFESGTFSNGFFYNSDFLDGEVLGGEFGKFDIPFQKTRIWSGTFSNLKVLNANFLSQDFLGSNIPRTINWLSGEFLGGQFGNNLNNQYENFAIWNSGYFRGGDFINKAEWKDGTFTGGRFLSHWGYDPDKTPYEISNQIIGSFSWQSGTFTGGEFGTGLESENSLWYGGKFLGGKFLGRFWRDGIFSNGEFLGSGIDIKPIIPKSKKIGIDNSNLFILKFHTDFFGYWNNGVVSGDIKRFSNNQNWDNINNSKVKLSGVLWNSGTFSHSEGQLFNSVFLSGDFESGDFINSSFNPYINLAQLIGDISSGINDVKVQPGLTYTSIVESGSGILESSFTTTNLTHSITSTDIKNIIIFPGSSGFRNNANWLGGNAIESDIFYTKWRGGYFESKSNSSFGDLWGVIWESGEMAYGNMNNSLWLSGIWKNGNFNGSPFNETYNYTDESIIVYPGFATDILKYINDGYNQIGLTSSLLNNLHINNLFSKNPEFLLNDDFKKWAPSGPKSVFIPSGWQYMNDAYIISLTNSYTSFSEPRLQTSGNSIFTWKNDSGDSSIIDDYDIYEVIVDFIVNDLSPSLISQFNYKVEIGFGDSTQEFSGTFRVFELLFNNNPTGFYVGGQKVMARFEYKFSGNSLINNSLTIKNLINSQTNILSVSNIRINKLLYGYNKDFNNKLSSTTFSSSSYIELPNGEDLSYKWETLSSNFGNGTFISGIWENGVWLDGYKSDPNIEYFRDLVMYERTAKTVSYELSPKRWLYKLEIDVYSKLKPGDRVSVSNIVGIDINSKRRLIRDYSTVLEVNNDSEKYILLSVDINFPIRTIIKDSDCHRIMVSKNIHLNGVLLSGYFKNIVWNNGLTRGYPYITVIEDSHWIDGIFKGGRFISKELGGYNSGVLQNVEFYDENISGKAFKFKYNSWMDLVYSDRSSTSLERKNKVFRQTPLGFTYSFKENNLYGRTTPDILESESTIRNSHDLLNRKYKLGCKFTEYVDYLIDGGQFLDINSLLLNNNDMNNVLFNLGDDLIDKGWTFSSQSNKIFASSSLSISSNIGSLDSEWLYLEGGKTTSNVSPVGSPKNFNLEIFNNSSIEIEPLRYSFVEIEAQNLDFKTEDRVSNPIIFYNNYPITQSPDSDVAIFNSNVISIPQNELDKEYVINKRAYFFNKTDLDLFIFSNKKYKIRFKRIRFVETDMIPFLNLGGNCIRAKEIVTWDSADVRWDLAGDDNGTWDNFYIQNPEQLGQCISYINSDIVNPIFIKSPDLEYESDIILNNFKIGYLNRFLGLSFSIKSLNAIGDPVGERCLCGIKQKVITFDDILPEVANPPIVNTLEADNIKFRSAKISGKVVNNGGGPILKFGFYWGYGTSSLTNKIELNIGNQFNTTLSNLFNNTTIYFRAFAQNSKGESFGTIKSFKTVFPFVTGIGNNIGNIFGNIFGNNSDPLIDIDGNSYKTIKIGNQVWMAENLRVNKYKDGIDIPFDESWTSESPLSGLYDNDETNRIEMGLLYNYYVIESGDICPDGWRIPTEADFLELSNTLSSSDLSSRFDWNTSTTPNSPGFDLNSNNNSGFNAYPSGFRTYIPILGSFDDNINILTGFWTSTNININSQRITLLRNDVSSMLFSVGNKSNGYSIRLIKI